MLSSGAQLVVINELQALAPDRALRYDMEGRAVLGCDVPWYALEYSTPSFWRNGPGPFGFGYAETGTDLQTEVLNQAMSFYLRREFHLTEAQAAAAGPLELLIDYDDGFVAYLNGVEIARRNLGPAGAFVFADQQTYNTHPAAGAETIVAANEASGLLRTGLNVLAIQVHNNAVSEGPQDAPATAPGGGRMRCAAVLRTAAEVLVAVACPRRRDTSEL